MKNRNLSIVFYTLIFFLSGFSSNAGVGNHEKESNWSKKIKEKKLNNLRYKLDSSKTSYPEPFLTIHLGVAYAVNTGNVQLNSEKTSGTNFDIHNDIGIPKTTIYPRVNAVLNFGNFRGLAFDTYGVRRKGDEVINKDIKYGNTTFISGSHVKSEMMLNYINLSFIKFFYDNGRARAAFLAGATGILYSLKINETSLGGNSHKESVFVPLPSVGLNGSIYLRKNLFLRAVVKYSAWWTNSYKCNVININPYFEYYIFKNFGLGMRYNFGYTNIKELPDKTFNGSIKNTLSAVAVVFVYRFIKKS